MRIRNTKPEFWRSKRVAELIPNWEHRLILKALESYVDDNGVGKDDLALIVSDCFSQDIALDPSSTFKRVNEGITALFEAGFIHRYEADGEKLLFISWWESTQYVNRPAKGRNPRPDGSMEYGETEIGAPNQAIQEASRAYSAESGNQGIRESGNQGLKPPAADTDGQSETTSSFELDHPEPPLPTTAELFKRFWAAYPRKDDKGKALEKFKTALGRASAEEIIAGAERYRDDPNRDPGFTKLPTTWLNADAWDNGPLPQRTPPQQFQSAAERRAIQGMNLVQDELREFYQQHQEIEQ